MRIPVAEQEIEKRQRKIFVNFCFPGRHISLNEQTQLFIAKLIFIIFAENIFCFACQYGKIFFSPFSAVALHVETFSEISRRSVFKKKQCIRRRFYSVNLSRY